MASYTKSRAELTSDIVILKRDVVRLTKLAAIHRHMIQVIVANVAGLSGVAVPSINSSRSLIAGSTGNIWGLKSSLFVESNIEELLNNVPQTTKAP